jgi:site-specific DNA-cytosine methylase
VSACQEEGINMLLESGARYIQSKCPDGFVVESTFQKRRRWDVNEALKGALADLYDIDSKILNPMHYGVPQSRPRLYIVGILSGKRRRRFCWPRKTKIDPIPIMNEILGEADLHSAIQPDLSCLSNRAANLVLKRVQAIVNKGGNPLTETWFIDCHNAAIMRKDICPPLATRVGDIYITNRGSTLTPSQTLWLQGIDPDRVALPEGVTERQFARAIRDSATVPLLAKVALSLCKALDYVPRERKS